jgi:hypothetical protein
MGYFEILIESTGRMWRVAVIDAEAILRDIRENRARMRTLGLSEERERDYYNSLSVECFDPEQDERAFVAAITGLNLSEREQCFLRQFLESGDPR